MLTYQFETTDCTRNIVQQSNVTRYRRVGHSQDLPGIRQFLPFQMFNLGCNWHKTQKKAKTSRTILVCLNKSLYKACFRKHLSRWILRACKLLLLCQQRYACLRCDWSKNNRGVDLYWNWHVLSCVENACRFHLSICQYDAISNGAYLFHEMNTAHDCRP